MPLPHRGVTEEAPAFVEAKSGVGALCLEHIFGDTMVSFE